MARAIKGGTAFQGATNPPLSTVSISSVAESLIADADDKGPEVPFPCCTSVATEQTLSHNLCQKKLKYVRLTAAPVNLIEVEYQSTTYKIH